MNIVLKWSKKKGITLFKKMKFSFEDFCCKYDRIRRKLRIWSYLLEKPLMEKFFFCVMIITDPLWYFPFVTLTFKILP